MTNTPAINRGTRAVRSPMDVVQQLEHVVIGSANYVYAWLIVVKEPYTAMVFEYPAPCCSVVCGKGGVLSAWFSEPPNTELARNLGCPSQIEIVLNSHHLSPSWRRASPAIFLGSLRHSFVGGGQQ
jgi:hypothetical protein